MAILFSDIEAAVRTDLSQTASGIVDSDTVSRYCREVYHELIHTKPDLQTVFNSDGTITDLPDTLADTASSFPDSLDSRRVAILAGVRARFTKVFLTSDTQIARFKLDDNEFNTEQGVTKPR